MDERTRVFFCVSVSVGNYLYVCEHVSAYAVACAVYCNFRGIMSLNHAKNIKGQHLEADVDALMNKSNWLVMRLRRWESDSVLNRKHSKMKDNEGKGKWEAQLCVRGFGGVGATSLFPRDTAIHHHQKPSFTVLFVCVRATCALISRCLVWGVTQQNILPTSEGLNSQRRILINHCSQSSSDLLHLIKVQSFTNFCCHEKI